MDGFSFGILEDLDFIQKNIKRGIRIFLFIPSVTRDKKQLSSSGVCILNLGCMSLYILKPWQLSSKTITNKKKENRIVVKLNFFGFLKRHILYNVTLLRLYIFSLHMLQLFFSTFSSPFVVSAVVWSTYVL